MIRKQRFAVTVQYNGLSPQKTWYCGTDKKNLNKTDRVTNIHF